MRCPVYPFLFLFAVTFARGAENLREEDPSLEKTLSTETINKRIQMGLYYQGREGHYLVFYDFKRDSIYLQYRVDEWDYRNDFVLKHLARGLLYFVEFDHMAIRESLPKNLFRYLEQDKEPKNGQAQGFNSNPLNRKKGIFLGKFVSFDDLYLNKLIY